MTHDHPQRSEKRVNKPVITIALAGNPNAGKSTLFNNLTGSHQHVGNYPGVTVEIKEGFLEHRDYRLRVVDLPGTYSLSAYSVEERVARNYILNEHPDLIINVVDGSNLERNLYLPLQFLELGVPLVIALNMADEMKRKGIHAHLGLLSDFFQAPIVPTVGSRDKGTKQLIETAVNLYERPRRSEGVLVRYDAEIEEEMTKLVQMLAPTLPLSREPGEDKKQFSQGMASPRWFAIKLLENDPEVCQTAGRLPLGAALLEQGEKSRRRLRSFYAEEPEMILAEQRYGHVHGICRSALRQTAQARIDFSEKIDHFLTNRILGLPIFAVLMYLTFWLVFALGSYPMSWIEAVQHHLAAVIAGHWPDHALPLLRSLILDGIIAGVGGVIIFLPNIMLLFFALALLEDTGYMARAAFIMDRLMKWIGLHGKSFIPMLCGFGCTVPGILGTRILENRQDRLTTILVLPLMSCGARIPIYLLLIPAFFPPSQSATIMYAIYVIGILLAIIGARLLRSTLFKGQASPFVMELPPYRIPTAQALWLHTWQRSWLYLKKAGTVILGITIILWALSVFPPLSSSAVSEPLPASNAALTHAAAERVEVNPDAQALARLQYSYLGRLGHALEPVFRPLGFDWRINTALIGALAAKEVFVAQLGLIFSMEEAPAPLPDAAAANKEADRGGDDQTAVLRLKLRRAYTPLTGFCVMLFCLISTPCIATFAAVKREAGWRWAFFQMLTLTFMAYGLTWLTYQAGSFLHLGTQH